MKNLLEHRNKVFVLYYFPPCGEDDAAATVCDVMFCVPTAGGSCEGGGR